MYIDYKGYSAAVSAEAGYAKASVLTNSTSILNIKVPESDAFSKLYPAFTLAVDSYLENCAKDYVTPEKQSVLEKANLGYYNRHPELFHPELEEYLNFSHFPEEVKSKIHILAYERGHSVGYSEIINYLYDYVDLAESALKLGGGQYSKGT